MGPSFLLLHAGRSGSSISNHCALQPCEGSSRFPPPLVISKNNPLPCREECQRQQPLRSATPRGFIKLTDTGGGCNMWVPGPSGCPSMFLSTSADGGCHLLNADSNPAEPVRLALTLRKPGFPQSLAQIWPFLGRDGMLRIAEASQECNLPSIVWHRIDPVSGTTLRSVQKCTWMTIYSLKNSYNAEAHRAVGLAYKDTVAIMDPEDFTKICHLNTASVDAVPNKYHRRCCNIEWSADGKLLAVQVEAPLRWECACDMRGPDS